MTDIVEEICKAVEDALKSSAKVDKLSAPVTIDSSMNDPREWDSLAFVSVFMTVSQRLNIEVEDDDAINFTSVEGIRTFVEELR